MSTSESTCWTVIQAAAAGNPADRGELARRYLGVVRAYLAARWRGSGLRPDLDDAVQEVFVECFGQGGALAAAGPVESPAFATSSTALSATLPPVIANEAQLDDLLSEPFESAIETLRRLDGDFMLLGVGGKMGPTLARMARRALDALGKKTRVLGVARFSQAGLEEQLRGWGIETLHCDLLDPDQVARLPRVPNIVAMFGMKFGATGQEALTWAMNVYAPALVCRHFQGSRVVAFSTGNVYGLTPVAGGGSRETDALQPVGDYSQSCVGRERIYEYSSRTQKMPMALLRLNYANEMRYGVLVDVARKVLSGEPIDVTMGHFNAIWQGDANAQTLAAFAHLDCPPRVLNLAGPETLSVRAVAEEFGRLLGKPPRIQGTEAADAYLSNAQLSQRLFGPPRVPVQQMMQWIAAWLQRGGRTLGKPTHFEVRDGKF